MRPIGDLAATPRATILDRATSATDGWLAGAALPQGETLQRNFLAALAA